MKVSDISTRKKMTLKEFSELCGVKYKTFHFRLTHGYSVFEAITIQEEMARSRASTKHGMHGSAEYRTWESMVSRCKNHPHYLRLGITVCEKWMKFTNFFADMGLRPDGMSLDRWPNGNGNYEPGNCRWATPVQQSQNTSRNINISAFGKTQCVAEWSRETGLDAKTIYQRLERGYTAEQALTADRYEWVTHAR